MCQSDVKNGKIVNYVQTFSKHTKVISFAEDGTPKYFAENLED